MKTQLSEFWRSMVTAPFQNSDDLSLLLIPENNSPNAGLDISTRESLQRHFSSAQSIV